MKKLFIQSFCLLFLISLQINSQSFFRSVADVDSFAYVTKDDQILVLKRDQANDLRLVNFLPFLTNYKDNMFNSAIIINDYLLVSSKDSLVLFSISNRKNPVELHRIFLNNIWYINKFGDYCLVYVEQSSTSPLFKIENDSLKLINQFPISFGTTLPVVFYTQNYALSYPYLYKSIYSPSAIEIYRYDETINQVAYITSIFSATSIYGIVSNSTYLFTLGWTPGFPYGTRFFNRYQILPDSLQFLNRSWSSQGNTAIPDGWYITDNYGVYDFIYDANIGNPESSQYSTNIQATLPLNPFYVRNSAYRIGENNFWYLHQLNGMDMTFKQFIMPTLPSKPILVSPLNNQIINSDTVNFVWRSSAPEVKNYSLDISSDSLFITFIDTLIADTFFTTTGLNQNQKYFWRVRAQNLIGWSNYSNAGSFTVLVTSVENSEGNNFQFNLEQNYPNPFNPSTKISWQSPEASWQTLKVFDVLGREVVTLVDEYRNAGSYDIEFIASALPSGVYFYQLKAGEFIETKKMLLIK